MERPIFALMSVVLMLLLSGSTVPAAAADSAEVKPTITRFSQVGERLFRGGQPRDNEFAVLKSLGVRTVVSFREDDTSERTIVEKLGMKFVHIPVTFTAFAPTTKLPEKAVQKFFEVIDDPENGPVFVHCRRGADRTGAFVGLYRMVREKWTAQRAYDEARKIGMRWWYFGVREQLDRVAKAFAEAEVTAEKTLAEAAEAPTLSTR